MLSRIAEFIYTIVFRPRPLRRLVNKIILAVLPSQVKYGDARVVLNPADPVVSGALFFRVYEQSETEFVRKSLGEGDLFLDIGANIGYYTALAASLVGKPGMVLAFEPDPDSYHYLQHTIAVNNADNVKAFNLGISDGKEEKSLYISSDNRGDNRMHAFPGASDKVSIHTDSIDNILHEQGVWDKFQRIFIKIDIQGSEGQALCGMETLLRSEAELVLLMEFWPLGLEEMGTEPLQMLEGLEAHGLRLYILGKRGKLTVLDSKSALIKKLHGRKYTNIVGLRNRYV